MSWFVISDSVYHLRRYTAPHCHEISDQARKADRVVVVRSWPPHAHRMREKLMQHNSFDRSSRWSMTLVTCRRSQHRCPCLQLLKTLVAWMSYAKPLRFSPQTSSSCPSHTCGNMLLVRWDGYWVHVGWTPSHRKRHAVLPPRSPGLRCPIVHCPDHSRFESSVCCQVPDLKWRWSRLVRVKMADVLTNGYP